MTEVPPAYLDFYERLRQLDRKGALEVVRDYLAAEDDVEGLYVDVLMPALIHAGGEWEADRISVAHEHYISEVTRDLIRQYGPRLWADAPGGGPVTVACCAPGERHSIGLMMVVDILRAEGVDVEMLGEGAPAEAIRDFAIEAGADLLCLSCALDVHLPDAADLIGLVRQSWPGLIVLAGGAAFGGDPGRALAIGADHYAADARAARQLMPELLGQIGR